GAAVQLLLHVIGGRHLPGCGGGPVLLRGRHAPRLIRLDCRAGRKRAGRQGQGCEADRRRRFHRGVSCWATGASSRRTLNQNAYSAGRKKIVSTVATVIPPIRGVAMGPKKLLRNSGIRPRTAAMAVKVIGRKRRTAAPTIASKRVCPSR